MLLPQRELEPASLAGILRGLDRGRLRDMAARARALAKADAAEVVADECAALAKGKKA
jgi:UDP-N-acetylglucosamine--N-acetylmuramyl-(pentapeptide) pyrophosphoryl-undecaprenol N-acetylglucosamine transferase